MLPGETMTVEGKIRVKVPSRSREMYHQGGGVSRCELRVGFRGGFKTGIVKAT